MSVSMLKIIFVVKVAVRYLKVLSLLGVEMLRVEWFYQHLSLKAFNMILIIFGQVVKVAATYA